MLIQLADNLGYTQYAITTASKNVRRKPRGIEQRQRSWEDSLIVFPHGIHARKRSSTALPEVGGDYLRWAGNCVSHFGLHDYLYILLIPFLRRIPQSVIQVLWIRNQLACSLCARCPKPADRDQ